MKRLFGVILALAFATPAFAQMPSIPVPPCGAAVVTPNTFGLLGSNGWVVYTVGTNVNINFCVSFVQVQGSVSGIPGSSASASGTYNASVRKEVPVPRTDNYVANGVHKYLWFFPPPAVLFGLETVYTTSPTVTVTLHEAEEESCQSGGNGGTYYVWDPVLEECVEFFGTPIVIDTTGDGYRFTGINDGVLFDLDADGQLDRVAWTHRNSDVAFLAMDRNGNGKIDNGAELFGDHTPVVGGTTSNGFEALKFLESLPTDGYITDRDPEFARLLLWIDRNHNGISEPEELQCAAEAGVEGISLAYKHTRREDRFGNEFRLVGKLTWADRRRPINIFDVWLKRQ